MFIKYMVLVYISIAYVASGKPKSVFVNIDPEILQVLLKISTECVDKTGVDSETMQKFVNFIYEDNNSMKKFMYCFAKSSGYADDQGYLVKEKLVPLVGDHVRKNDFVNNIDECNKLKGSNKYDTLFTTANCFRNTSPILFKF